MGDGRVAHPVLGGEVTASGTSRFADVDASEWWSRHAEELAERNITQGCATGPLRYCPTDSVTRAQMATFLVRAYGLDAAGSAGFTDTAGNRHEANIDALAAAEITSGCSTYPLRYCPDDSVTRAQMATFLHRALMKHKDETTEPEPVSVSDDVPDVDLTDMSTGDTVNLRSSSGATRGCCSGSGRNGDRLAGGMLRRSSSSLARTPTRSQS